MSLNPQSFSVIDPWPDVPNRLKVRILNKNIGGVTGLMPKEVSAGFENQWKAPFSDIARGFNTGLKAGQELSSGSGVVDVTLNFKQLTNQIWEGTGAVSTNLNLVYISRREGAQKDVIDPVKMLLKLFGPAVNNDLSTEGGSITMLKAPQPVMLEIGYVMAWREALPTSMSYIVSNISDSKGLPTKITVTLGFKTDKCYVVGDPDIEFGSSEWEKIP